MKKCDNFLIFAQNKGRGYTLEPPHLRTVEIPQTTPNHRKPPLLYMVTVKRGGNGCDIATIRAPLAFNMLVLVWRVVANVIGGRDSRSDMTSIGKE